MIENHVLYWINIIIFIQYLSVLAQWKLDYQATSGKKIPNYLDMAKKAFAENSPTEPVMSYCTSIVSVCN